MINFFSKRKILFGVILFIVVVILIGGYGYKYLQYRKDKMEKYADYGSYTNSVQGLTVEMNFEKSFLLDEQGNSFYRFGDGSGGYSGYLGRLQAIEPREANWKIPSKIKAQWISYEEDQFYEGEFELPRELIAQRLHDKTQGLFIGNGSEKVRLNDKLLITFAPKGKMYVYLTGYTTKLVGNFQGKAIDYNWKQWLLDNSNDNKEIEAIKNGQDTFIGPGGTTFHIKTRPETVKEMSFNKSEEFERQKKTYNEGYFHPVKWQLKTKGQIDKLLGVNVAMVNGEIDVLQDESEIKKHVFTSVPLMITIDFLYQGKPYRENYDFDNSRIDYTFLYQRYIKNFNPLEKVTVSINRINADSGELLFIQGEKKLDIEGLLVTALDR